MIEQGGQDIREIIQLVERYNSKWDGTTRLLRLTLLLTLDDDQIALLAGPPLRNTSLPGRSRLQ
jgi:hypothetical protein